MKNLSSIFILLIGTLLFTACSKDKAEPPPSPKAEYLLEWGSSGPRDSEFDQPIGIAIDDEGFIHISDSENNVIKKFSEFGELYDKWSNGGSEETALQTPMHIASDGENLYVTEYDTDRVQKFSADHKSETIFGTGSQPEGALDTPSGVAVDGEGNVYVSGFYNGSVKKYSPEGEFLIQIGTAGKKDEGKLNHPTDVAVGADGNIYVADAYNDRVQVFTPLGEFLRKWGDTPKLGNKNIEGSFNVATGIGIDSEGRVYVADFYNNRIQVFDPEGKFLLSFGTQGRGEGQFERPTDVAVDKAGNIYVVDWGNDRVQKLRIIWPEATN
ncbi:MAG: SMP-30/gluconolactonase/LRE family protein [Thermodesulfobacteriota bacterium]